VAISHYDYDANGNRLTAPNITASPVYDAQDRLTSYGACTYGHKPDGSLQTKTCPEGTTSYDYDAFGNLRRVTLPDGTPIDYLIDGQNRRIGKKVNGVMVERFLYRNQLQPAAWLNGDGTVKARFIYGGKPNVPEYMVTSAGATYRIVTDQVGSVRLVVDTTSGTLVERLDWDEFGIVFADSAPGTQSFGFAGGIRDSDTGLTRFGARDYDPSTGRWITQDPLVFDGRLTNLYGYVGNDSINGRDPLGLLFRGRLNAGEEYGEAAAQWWADQYLSHSGWSAVPFAIEGGFASLWTPCTSDKTAGTLATAYAIRVWGPFSTRGLPRWLARTRKFIRFDPPHHGKGWEFDGDLIKWLRDLPWWDP
jgi:RHS repeat-associated protein